MLTGATKDPGHTNAEWQVKRDLIAGVFVKEMKHIVTRNGLTTELYRPEWGMPIAEVRHVIHVNLRPAAISAWHMHQKQHDVVACVSGSLKLVLYDDREDSHTRGMVNVFALSDARPMAAAIPPGIWHGIRNLNSGQPCSFVIYFDRPYNYDDPDEWRLPADTDQIPHRI